MSLLNGCLICDMDQALAIYQSLLRAAFVNREGLTQQLGEMARHSMGRNSMKLRAVMHDECAIYGSTKRMRFFQDCIEYRCKIARRGIDDLQDLSDRLLLLQRLA